MSGNETTGAGVTFGAASESVVLSNVRADGVGESPPLTAAMFRTSGEVTRAARKSAIARPDAGPNSGAGQEPVSADPGSDPGVRVTLPGVVGLLTLRADPARTNLADALAGTLDLALPGNLRASVAGAHCLRGLSPDEWLLSCPLADSLDVETRLRAALEGSIAITNVSGGYAVFELAGPAARQVLAKSTPLDVDPRAFGVGRVVGTVFAKSTVVLRRMDEARYELICRRSFADYIARWVAHAAAEYGLSVTDSAV